MIISMINNNKNMIMISDEKILKMLIKMERCDNDSNNINIFYLNNMLC